MNRVLQIGSIWLGCALAWVLLGETLVQRSGETSGALSDEVHALWGPPLQLAPPIAAYEDDKGSHRIRLDGSDLHARLHLVQRQKGLLWFPTYDVELDGRYRFLNDSGASRRVDFAIPLSADHALFDGFSVLSDDGEALETTAKDGAVRWSAILADGEKRSFHIALRSRGTSTFGYAITGDTGDVRDFHLVVETDCVGVDFPAGSLSPTAHRALDGTWRGEWTFDHLIAGMPIAVDLPPRENPGPLASRITFFAPVGLLFFFFVVAVRAAAKRESIHPLNYFFLGCAFFAFHLLFAYLVDHVAIAPALAIASVTSIFLVVSYARLFVSLRFALVDMALAQLCYLVLFSASFLWRGYTGLAITVGVIVTLFVMMQFTGRRALDVLYAPTR